MRDVSHGDSQAVLSALIETEPDRLRRRSISLGVPVSDAEDAAQTALLRAWRSVSHLETPQPGRMCAWLDVIARNVAIDLARQRARRPEAALGDDVAGEGASVESAVEVRVFLDGALTALHSLPETLREPLLLTVVDGLSTEEVAIRLGIEPAAARQRISRARRALRECRRTGMDEG
ncbi:MULTISPECIES: RNA polymerase sigma factor [Microbacterium]|uniref:RNA polymerase sigma factor n=1 Tax=Microbacterium TaxID=33882 RepID=UPI000F8FA836|nr:MULTISPECIES: RNA polymerase sigma factor [Microbacterium]AZS45990.1 ECF RNA polymerase sigma factor SigE [Microbacterium oxydans]WKT87653.1 RNA polymerase sigma factor [Microbacterium liquefaciens]